MEYNNINIDCLGHASFKIKFNEQIIYIDPYEIDANEDADVILITHEHYDHCNPKDINSITGPTTLIIAPVGAAKKLKGNVRTIKTGDHINLDLVEIEAVEAYHPRGLGVGYIITINNSRIYHTGDTDLISEMKTFKDIDIAFLPVSGVFVMNADEAVEAAEIIKPKIAIPMHYGSIVGSVTDAETFAEQIDPKVTEVKILCKKFCKPGECEARSEE